METMLNAFSACVVLLLLMSVGYFMGHRGWMGPSEKKFLSKFITSIAVPCMCIEGLLTNLDRSGLGEAAVMLLSAFVGVTVNLLIAAAVLPLLKLPRKQKGVFLAMAAYSNTVFIGVPVCQQLFGDACMPYVMTYYLINTSMFQMIGVTLIGHFGQGETGKITPWGFVKSLISKPPIAAVIVALVLLVVDWTPPRTIMRFMGYVADSVSPMALIYCGYVIFELGLRNLRLMKGLPTMLVLRLLIAPMICLGLCHVFGITGLARDVFVVESALPVVSQTPVMAGAYGADDKYAAVGATLSTIGCVVVIPILMLVLTAA